MQMHNSLPSDHVLLWLLTCSTGEAWISVSPPSVHTDTHLGNILQTPWSWFATPCEDASRAGNETLWSCCLSADFSHYWFKPRWWCRSGLVTFWNALILCWIMDWLRMYGWLCMSAWVQACKQQDTPIQTPTGTPSPTQSFNYYLSVSSC